MEEINVEFLWKDRKRHLGLPLSFTEYMVTEDRLIVEKGFLNISEDEILLYRVADLSLRMSLWQRLFGVGTVCVQSSDKTTPHFDIVNVKNPRDVKELLYKQVETCKENRRMRTTEIIDNDINDGDFC